MGTQMWYVGGVRREKVTWPSSGRYRTPVYTVVVLRCIG